MEDKIDYAARLDRPAEPVHSDVFLLPAEKFVQKCIEIFDIPAERIDPKQALLLVNSIKDGVSKLKVYNAVRSYSREYFANQDDGFIDRVDKNWENFCDIALLELYSDDRSDLFVNQIYEQLMGRGPTRLERHEAVYRLNSGAVSRRALVEELIMMSGGGATSEIFKIGEQIKEEGGRYTIARYINNGGYLFANFIDASSLEVKGDSLVLNNGWVFTGPKRNISTGGWFLSLDLIQSDDAELIIDVVANSGQVTLLKLHALGIVKGTFKFNVESYHNFIEVRVLKPAQSEEHMDLRINDISLMRCQ